MSKSNSGSRIYHWLFEENSKFNNILQENDHILLISFPEKNYMAPALETYIKHFLQNLTLENNCLRHRGFGKLVAIRRCNFF